MTTSRDIDYDKLALEIVQLQRALSGCNNILASAVTRETNLIKTLRSRRLTFKIEAFAFFLTGALLGLAIGSRL